MRNVVLAVALVALVGAAGCRGTADARNVPTEAASVQDYSPPREASLEVGDGCGQPRPEAIIEGKTTARRIAVDGTVRDYRVHYPAGTKADQRLPLLLNFHGRGSNAETQERYSGFVTLSEREKFVLVSPEGTGNPRSWAAGATIGTEVDDLAFVQAVVGLIRSELCIDGSRVFAAGFSNGAFMAGQVGCLWGTAIAAVAMVGGTTPPGDDCTGAPAVVAFHGTADTVVPFDGGLLRTVFPYPGARRAMDAWATRMECGGMEAKRLSKHVVVEERTGCLTPVKLYVVEGDGHTWPGAADIPAFGTTTREVVASEVIWAFFNGKR